MVEGGAQVVFLTGAAGSIGRATVQVLESRGLAVVTADRNRLPPSEARAVVEEILVDLLDEAALQNAMSRVRSRGQLRHVVGIAGGGDPEELAQSDPSTESLGIFTRVVANNLLTAFATIRHVVPLLRESHGDRSITLVGSINAFGGFGAPGYSAAKSGLMGLANALATPLGVDRIRINCLALGTVDTGHVRELAARGLAPDPDVLGGKAPLERVLTPTEVGKALAAIALDMPGLTGTTVILDNGQMRVR